MTQVDEAASLRGARSVRGTRESQSAAAEALRPHRQEVEQPPPDLQVVIPASQDSISPASVPPGLRPRASHWTRLGGFLSPAPQGPQCRWSRPTPTLTDSGCTPWGVFLQRRSGLSELLLFPPSLPPSPATRHPPPAQSGLTGPGGSLHQFGLGASTVQGQGQETQASRRWAGCVLGTSSFVVSPRARNPPKPRACGGPQGLLFLCLSGQGPTRAPSPEAE